MHIILEKAQNMVDSLVAKSSCTGGSNKLRLNHYIWLAITAIPLSTYFIIKNILNQHYHVAITVFIFFTCMAGSLLVIPKIKQITWIYHVNNCVFVTMLILLSTWGGKSEGLILWCYVYPLISIFLFGYQSGVKWSLFLLFAIIVSSALNHNIVFISYSSGFEIRFYVVYLTVLSITSWLEYSRSRYTATSLRQRTELEQERESLRKEISRRIQLEEKLNKLANQDGLTDMYNRRYFLARASEELSRSQRYKIPLAMALIDIDKFKNINDTYGHPAGDEVLKCFSQVCKQFLRTSDIYGRIGGEEFAILLFHVSEDQAMKIMDNLRQKVSELQCTHEDKEFKVTISIGISIPGNQPSSIDSLYSTADKALYHAKNNGRNKVKLAIC